MASAFKKGQYVRFTGQEGDEKFSYDGKVLSAKGTNVVMLTDVGTMSLDSSLENIVAIEKPVKRTKGASSKKAVARKSTVTSTQKVAKSAKRKAKAGSKQEQVNKIYAEMVGASRKEIIAAVVEAGITTAAGASTMVSNAKKAMA